MKLERSITVSEKIDIIRDRIDAYLNEVGYKQVRVQPDLLYQRGSLLGSLMSFTPKGWQAKANIQVLETSDNAINVVLDIDVNTTGQLVTEKERGFWNLELENFEKAVLSGISSIKEVSGSEKKIIKENLVVAAVFFFLAFFIVIIANLFLEKRLALWVGIFVGLALGFIIAKRWLKF